MQYQSDASYLKCKKNGYALSLIIYSRLWCGNSNLTLKLFEQYIGIGNVFIPELTK